MQDDTSYPKVIIGDKHIFFYDYKGHYAGTIIFEGDYSLSADFVDRHEIVYDSSPTTKTTEVEE